MMWARSSLVAIPVVLATAVASASADTVDLSFLGVGPKLVEKVSTDSGANFKLEDAGQFNFTASNKTGAVPAVIPGATVASWCIELDQDASTSVNTYTVLGPGFGAYVSPFTNSANVTAFFNQFFNPFFTTDQAVAFQLSIWELEFDTSPGSLGTGTFRADGADAAVTQANAWLAAFNSSTAGPWVVFQLHNDAVQDQIFAVQGGGQGNNPTPLPAGMVGGLALMGGVALLRKFRRVPAEA